MAFEAGQQVGEYQVVRILGRGGLGEVYEVRHAISQRAEAMKVLLPDQRAASEIGERFRREIQLLGALSHPHIASLHNAFYHDGQLIMVMELVSGETLRDKSLRMAMPVAQALRYTREILSALEYAHARGVVHRDIKPTNIMITAEDQVKLLDFGIAITERSAHLTAPGFMIGSVYYMSPEQMAGDKATPRSDIYSVGLTLYEILTGRLPTAGKSNFELMRARLNESPVAPVSLNPLLPVALSDVVLRALERDPADRFASAQEFLSALSQVRDTGVNEVLSVAATALHPAGSSGVGSQQKSGTPPGSFPLDDVSKKLAIYIGPIATVVVKKLATKCTSLDELYKEAATHITSETDRQRFLQSRRSRG
jgi:eukaryotic-like serine/threonine-protein kinase